MTSTTVTVPAARYADHDDSLAAAAEDYARDHRLVGWDLAPAWADDERDEIVLTVPMEARVSDLLAALSDHDRGDGCLGIIVRQALADDPGATVEDVRAIVLQAEEDARIEREREARLAAISSHGWSDECATDTAVVVAGRGASRIEVIRTADSDPALLTAGLARTLAGRSLAERCEGGWVLIGDAWCVSLDPATVHASDLDEDPAVLGYECVGTNG
jgi:hypothetical protein